MKLYHVNIEIPLQVVVVAEDDGHAWEVAYSDISEVLRDVDIRQMADIFVVREVDDISKLPKTWDGDCIPYGGDGNTRIKNLLKGETNESK